MKIGETVHFRIGEDIFEGVIISRSEHDYFGDGKGYSYKIRSKNGFVENVFGFNLIEENSK